MAPQRSQQLAGRLLRHDGTARVGEGLLTTPPWPRSGRRGLLGTLEIWVRIPTNFTKSPCWRPKQALDRPLLEAGAAKDGLTALGVVGSPSLRAGGPGNEIF